MVSDFDLLMDNGHELQRLHRPTVFRHMPSDQADGPEITCRFEHTGSSGGGSQELTRGPDHTLFETRARITWDESELKAACVRQYDRFVEADSGTTWMVASSTKVRSGQVTVEITRSKLKTVGSA